MSEADRRSAASERAKGCPVLAMAGELHLRCLQISQPRPISHGAAAAIALDRSLVSSIESRISVSLHFPRPKNHQNLVEINQSMAC